MVKSCTPDGKPTIEGAEESFDAASSVYEVVKTNLKKAIEGNPIGGSEIVGSV